MNDYEEHDTLSQLSEYDATEALLDSLFDDPVNQDDSIDYDYYNPNSSYNSEVALPPSSDNLSFEEPVDSTILRPGQTEIPDFSEPVIQRRKTLQLKVVKQKCKSLTDKLEVSQNKATASIPSNSPKVCRLQFQKLPRKVLQLKVPKVVKKQCSLKVSTQKRKTIQLKITKLELGNVISGGSVDQISKPECQKEVHADVTNCAVKRKHGRPKTTITSGGGSSKNMLFEQPAHVPTSTLSSDQKPSCE